MNRKDKNIDEGADIIFGSEEMRESAPAQFIPSHKTSAQTAYQIVKDETFPQTQPRLNLATFVTTYMDDYGTRLMNDRISACCSNVRSMHQHGRQHVEHTGKVRMEDRSSRYRFF